MRQWRCLNDKDRRKFAKKTARCPDTVTSVYNPDSNLGSITETLDAIIDNYTRERKIDKSFDQEEFKVRIIKMSKLKEIQQRLFSLRKFCI